MKSFNNREILADLQRVSSLPVTAEYARDFDMMTMAQVLRDELPAIKKRCRPQTYAVVLGVVATMFKNAADCMLHKMQKYDGAGNPIPKAANLSVIDGGKPAGQG